MDEKKVIPFPLEANPTDIRLPKVRFDEQYMVTMVDYAIDLLAKTGRTAKPLRRFHGELPAVPFITPKWRVEPVTDESTLPREIRARLAILRKHKVPIKYVFIAHERDPEGEERKKRELERKEEEKLLRAERRKEMWSNMREHVSEELRLLGSIVVAIAIAVAVVYVLPIILQAIAGLLVGLVILGGFYMISVCGVDPVVFIVVDDGRLSWIAIGNWYEPPS
jgi:hypothetical protein